MNKDRSIGFSDVHTQIKITNKLLAAQLKERLQQQDLVQLLTGTGASDQDIADVLGTTAATVSATKVRLKKKAQQ
jgi:DNA-binding CsgD family transcriptional regulator